MMTVIVIKELGGLFTIAGQNENYSRKETE